jgi:hypothetical protein
LTLRGGHARGEHFRSGLSEEVEQAHLNPP